MQGGAGTRESAPGVAQGGRSCGCGPDRAPVGRARLPLPRLLVAGGAEETRQKADRTADLTGCPGTREAGLWNWGAILNFAATAAACVSCRGTKKRPGKEDVQRPSRLRGFPVQNFFKNEVRRAPARGGEHQN
ncbi:hypothetical protein NDU88_003724 [Pleurodeles waltl]|uniref:Uncharacterized protein n=1 Tax=Pleurodeles waltl TaxID=8319 RepID=A0AAV7T6X2_PLEWA|nr:hypothetical protein NDU88_003724 [Pleurodeles waltl]